MAGEADRYPRNSINMERDMFDTMTMTKLIGGLCGAFLIFLLGSWGADALYSTEAGGHGDDHASDAYPIEVAASTDAGTEEEGPSFSELLASADAGKGERVFKKCTACHSAEPGVNGTGPTLFGVVERDIAGIDGFGFSGTLEGLEGNWTPEALSGFLENPRGYAPGTAMGFAGLRKVEDRANLVAYLQTLQ